MERNVSVTIDDTKLAPTLDAIYDAAIHAEAWPRALVAMGGLFQSHFVDLFARTVDWSAHQGLAIGLDQSDYEDVFLGQWSQRNVWSSASPAQFAGEVKPTWQMVDRQDVLRSPIYNEYLKKRDLNEGLRLVLWSGEGWLQHISLIRPWSAGPFDGEELEVARTLLPHLQRAAATSRSLRGVDALSAFDTLDRAAFLLDPQGRVVRCNAACDPLLAISGGLAIRSCYLEAGSAEDTRRLATAIAEAGRISSRLPLASTLTLGPECLSLTVMPVRDRSDRDLPAPRSVLVLVAPVRLRPPVTERELMASYGLTQAEAALSCGLLEGRGLAYLAAARGRSVNTLRAQLARVMTKTNTRRQSELILLLSQLG